MNATHQPSVLIDAERPNFAQSVNPPEDSIFAGFVLAKAEAEMLKHKLTSLTTREIEVLRRVAEGNANKQMAAELGISIKTVEKHREHLMNKLNLHNTASLTRYAICVGALGNTFRRLVGQPSLIALPA